MKKKVTSILFLINTIASYSDSKNYKLNGFTTLANSLFEVLIEPPSKEVKEQIDRLYPNFWERKVIGHVEEFCNYANAIRFNFTKKSLKIVLPKIKSLNLGINVNK